MGFFRNLSVSEIIQAELVTILKGLLLAWEMGIRLLVCYTDSMLALNLVSNPSNQFDLYAALIQTIKDVLKRDWTLLHTLREGNAAADYLAKLGAQCDERWMTFEAPLVDMVTTLANDAKRCCLFETLISIFSLFFYFYLSTKKNHNHTISYCSIQSILKGFFYYFNTLVFLGNKWSNFSFF